MHIYNTTVLSKKTLYSNTDQVNKNYDETESTTSSNNDYSFDDEDDSDDEDGYDNDSCCSCGATRSTITSAMEEVVSTSSHSSKSQKNFVQFDSVIIREFSTTSNDNDDSQVDITYNLFEYEYFRRKNIEFNPINFPEDEILR